MALTLSILIATMPERKLKFDSLMESLSRQLTPQVEVITDDSMAYNIGNKRNRLLKRASGEYVVFIDDDDSISPGYVQAILLACKKGPDCIGISGIITTNGVNERQWHISKSYERWYELNCVYYRTPNHISPVKRELALKAGFPEISFGEDAEYSRRLLPLLYTEVKIPGNIYKYQYVNKKVHR